MHAKNERRCIACRQCQDKNNLIRIAKINNVVDFKQNSDEGRGAYICKSKECIEKVIKTKAINRIFKCQISDEIYNKLRCKVE